MDRMTLAVVLTAGLLALLPTASAVTPPFSEGFESGVARHWELTGTWNVNTCGGSASPGVLTSMVDRRPTGGSCGFHPHNGASSATTPPIVVDGPSMLTFESNLHAPAGCFGQSKAHILISMDDGPFNAVTSNVQCAAGAGWNVFSLDLAPFEGHTVRVQFLIVINVHMMVWSIDNLALSGPAYPTPELGSLALAGAGVAVIAGVALVNRRK